MEKAWSRCRGGGANNKKITFIFQNEPFLLLTGYLEFHFRSQGKSGKSQGIPSWKKSGNPARYPFGMNYKNSKNHTASPWGWERAFGEEIQF